MRIVVDTKVLVSSLLSPFGPSNAIRQLIAAGAVQVCYDVRILHEYREVLTRPRFPFSEDDVHDLLSQIRGRRRLDLNRSIDRTPSGPGR